jgi:voltage-gated potassium channel
MLISSLLIYGAEHEVQPDKFANAFSGLWWAVATLTTVGYGDIYPLTALGKILSSIIALLGIGMVAVPTGIISAGFLEVMACKEKEGKHEAFKYCPHCGGKLFEHTEK